jgi:hypothetical protein
MAREQDMANSTVTYHHQKKEYVTRLMLIAVVIVKTHKMNTYQNSGE